VSGFDRDDADGALGEEQPFVAVLPSHPVRRPPVGFVAPDDLAGAFCFALMRGPDDDLVSDMSLHGDLPAVVRL
jgi:hypothetical protein